MDTRIYWVDGWGWQWRPVLDLSPRPEVEWDCPLCHNRMPSHTREATGWGGWRYVCPPLTAPDQEVD